jgi:hypothetical protein
VAPIILLCSAVLIPMGNRREITEMCTYYIEGTITSYGYPLGRQYKSIEKEYLFNAYPIPASARRCQSLDVRF